MEFYKMEEQSVELVKSKNQPIPSVSGNEMSFENRVLLEKLRNGEQINENVVFDYFIMMSYGDKRNWERTIKDVHGYILVGAGQNSFYISSRVKEIFVKYTILDELYFYPSKLLFKKEKYDYWIMKFHYDYTKHLIFKKSTFSIHHSISYLFEYNYLNIIEDNNEFEKLGNSIREQKQRFYINDALFNKYSDLIILNSNFGNSGIYISEKLKIDLEENKITGFKFAKSDISFKFIS